MLPFTSKRILAIIGIAAFLFLSVLFSQSPTPVPLPSPDATPTVSPLPSSTPARAPSPTPLPGAQNFHQWGSVTVFNGLPSDSVRAIAQTPDGVMWFGTDNGLARFDGRRIQNFLPGGAETNRILALRTAATGDLWIGTSNGAFVYSESRVHPVSGSENFGITTILMGSDISLGTDAGLILRVTGDRPHLLSAAAFFTEPITLDDGTPLSITSLAEIDGKLLASTSGRGTFTVDSAGFAKLQSSPQPLFVNALATAETGVWIGSDAPRTLSGLYLTGTSPRAVRVPAPTSNVLSLAANDSGLWAGTERFGLFHIVKSKVKKNYTFENTSGGLRSNTVFTLFTDREGVLWIGTNRGVSRFDRLGASQETVSDIPNSNFIRALFWARKDWTVAGSNRGLFLSEGDRWKPVPKFDGKVVHAIAEHKNTELLIGTSSGVFDFSGRLIAPGDSRSFANAPGGTYAAIFGRGVIQITAGARGFGISDGPMEVIFPEPTVTAVGGSTDKLWIGTANSGLFSFDGKNIKKEIEPAVLASGTIWKIVQATDGAVWIAGQHGVFRIHDGRTERIVKTEDARDVIVQQGNEFWVATTTSGLLHGRNDRRFGWLVSTVGFEQGLPSEKAFSIIPADVDEFLIATNRGVVRFKPGTVVPKLIATRVLSQRVHDLAELNSTIALEYPQNSLLVEVAGQSSRTFPEEFQYGFLLTDAKGNEVGRRISNESQYAPADLSPGEYTIEAIAFNRDLLPSEPLLIPFSVAKAPFPWTATALSVLLLMALVALAWAIFEHRRIRQRNRELAAARLDLANEAERERRRIARDLHDQTLADLRNLMIKSDKFGYDKGEFRSEIEAVSTDIRRICEDLSPSVLENVGLVAALEFLLTGSVQSHRFSTSENADELVNFPMTVQLHIYRIAQEVLANITQHSTADLVEMNVDVSAEGRFLLTIRDNGEAFQPGKAHTGRGISNIRSRAGLINSEIGWTAQPEGGNLFSIRLGQ